MQYAHMCMDIGFAVVIETALSPQHLVLVLVCGQTDKFGQKISGVRQCDMETGVRVGRFLPSCGAAI